MSFLSWLFGKKPEAPAQEPSPAPRPILTTPRAPAAQQRPAAPAPASASFTLPAGPFRFIALDVETANSDSSSICQIGIACVRHDGTVHVASTLIDPEQPFSDFNVNLHGIGPAQVRGAPKFPAVLHQIAPLLGQLLIIQHSTFDRGAINGACRAYGLPEPGWQWADSVQIARRAWPEFRGNGGHGLGHLKQALALDFEHHDAGEDAKAAALVVLRAEAHTGQSLEDLIASPRKATPKARSPRLIAALPETDLAALAALVDRLRDTRPLTWAEIKEREATRTRYFDNETERAANWEKMRARAFDVFSPDQAGAEPANSKDDLGWNVSIVSNCIEDRRRAAHPIPPHYPDRVCVILRKAKLLEREHSFLAAFMPHYFTPFLPGINDKLLTRSVKIGAFDSPK